MALSCDTKPHFTTIADFVAAMDKEIVHLFRDVLLVCDDLGLIGKEMFAIDGCKLPSNASEEIDAYVADTLFRKRDPRFANYGRYKKRTRKERKRREGHNKLFSTKDFIFDFA